MATEKTTKRAVKKAPAKATETAAPVETTATVEAEQDEKKPCVPSEINPAMLITVKNGFQGSLVYKSPRTGEKYEWDNFGDEQDMELRELRNAKNAAKGFFMNNWFLFSDEDAWVLDYLGVMQYYKNALTIDEFDTVFELPATEVEQVVSKLSFGQKRSLAYRARTLIAEEKIDSMKMIAALERALDTQLVER